MLNIEREKGTPTQLLRNQAVPLQKHRRAILLFAVYETDEHFSSDMRESRESAT
jgi:hypothetical protein